MRACVWECESVEVWGVRVHTFSLIPTPSGRVTTVASAPTPTPGV